MPYPVDIVDPMRQELVDAGAVSLTTAAEVDAFFAEKQGLSMLIVNSVCGCAAGQARPGVKLALRHSVLPRRVGTVFAGQDLEATARAREYFAEIPPSSPSIALFQDGRLVHFVPRHKIQHHDEQSLATELIEVFEQFAGEAES